jgi:GDP-D-mannose dehydratase
MKRALITGVTEQDGSYPGELLLGKRRVGSDKSVRSRLVERGQLRAMPFSWAAMAEAVYEGYLRIV